MALDLDALKAQFAARGGKVSVVEPGVRAIASDRKIYAAMREGVRAKADEVAAADAAEARYFRKVEAFTAARMDGWSLSDTQDYAEHAK
jgi:hypothetical protein